MWLVSDWSPLAMFTISISTSPSSPPPGAPPPSLTTYLHSLNFGQYNQHIVSQCYLFNSCIIKVTFYFNLNFFSKQNLFLLIYMYFGVQNFLHLVLNFLISISFRNFEGNTPLRINTEIWYEYNGSVQDDN